MSNQINVEVNTEVSTDAVVPNKYDTKFISQLVSYVRELEERITALESKNQTSCEKREMTVADAERVIFGDMISLSHKEAEVALGLTYGQIYSARLGHTFKQVHKAAKDEGRTIWVKK